MASMTREEAARVLGMKAREVTDWDGEVALLFDGTRFEVHSDGAFEQLRGMHPAAPVVVAPEEAVGALDADPDVVPDGTVAEVLAWVGNDPERARQALGVEQQDKRRAGLTAQLEKLAAG